MPHTLGEALRPEAAKTRLPEINDRVRLQGGGFQLVTAYGKRKDGSPTLNHFVYYYSDHDGSTVLVQECPKEEAEFVILNKFWVVEPSRILANAGQQEIPESITEALKPRMAKVRVPQMGEVVQLTKFSAMNHNAHYTVTGFTKQDDYRPDQHQWPVRISDTGGIQDTGFVLTSICPREEAEFAILDDKWCVRLDDLTFT